MWSGVPGVDDNVDTDQALPFLDFEFKFKNFDEDVLKLLRSLDVNKAVGLDKLVLSCSK